jgi:hypothetical protein
MTHFEKDVRFAHARDIAFVVWEFARSNRFIAGVTVLGWFRWAKGTALRVGLKKVHRFVFGNWERLAMESVALAEKTASDQA